MSNVLDQFVVAEAESTLLEVLGRANRTRYHCESGLPSNSSAQWHRHEMRVNSSSERQADQSSSYLLEFPQRELI